ncbi:MAG: hypothetical protein ABF491_01895 [Acetobacter sp.]|uniref:hypothetical protein n=1 Tax=Acetobacter sp. TaxID=440 RepID=UPI0039EA315E
MASALKPPDLPHTTASRTCAVSQEASRHACPLIGHFLSLLNGGDTSNFALEWLAAGMASPQHARHPPCPTDSGGTPRN